MRHLKGGRGVGALAVAVAAGVLALGGAANAAPDSKGTDYWLMFPGNVATPTLSLFVASDVATLDCRTAPSSPSPQTSPLTGDTHG